MKRLCRFYCVDCDNAWLEILEDNVEHPEYHDKCDYCGKKQQAEEVTKDNEHQ
jgi:hypothetical protein